MKIKEVISYLEKIVPLAYQESYDNCGLIVGDESAVVNAVLITLDCTEVIVDEAIENGCNLIIAHHPIIFNGLKKITPFSLFPDFSPKEVKPFNPLPLKSLIKKFSYKSPI